MLLAALFTTALGAVAEVGPTPPSPRASATTRDPREAIELAGSGSNVPLTRALARAWASRAPGRPVVVHESVGSAGGIRALLDGAVDVAMISRPLRDGEAQGYRVARYATTEVVLAAHVAVTQREITPRELIEVLRGARTRWRDGTPLRFVGREAGDSSHRALALALPGFAEAEHEALRRRRFRVTFSDDDLRDALVETPGALGVTDRGGARMHGRPLSIITLSRAPSAPAITKDLAFVYRPGARPEVDALLDFARSPEGVAIARAAGYDPVQP